MASNRLYAGITCINPFCEEIYQPHDKRQIYHNDQCRSNYNNDKSYFNAKSHHKINDFNVWLLKALFQKVAYKGNIKEQILIDLDFNFEIGDWNINSDTNRPIKWFSEYGLEMIDIKERIFEIHKR